MPVAAIQQLDSAPTICQIENNSRLLISPSISGISLPLLNISFPVLFISLRPSAALPSRDSGDFAVSPNPFRCFTTSFVDIFVTSTIISSMYESVASFVLLPFFNTVFNTAAKIFGAILSPNPNRVRQYVFPYITDQLVLP